MTPPTTAPTGPPAAIPILAPAVIPVLSFGFTLNIIGKGPDLEFYKEKYLDSRVKFLGQIPNVDVLNIISNSYLVISTTKLYEGQPTLLCEASASGVPSIFPLTGGINEFFPEEYKFSFKILLPQLPHPRESVVFSPLFLLPPADLE